MTVLVGDSDNTSYTATDDSFDPLRAWVFENTAVANGNATTLKAYFYSLESDPIKLLLFNSTGTLLAATAEITTGAPGWISGSITPTAITSGQTYYLGWVTDTGDYVIPYNDGSTWAAYYHGGYSYSSPGNITPGSLTNQNYGWVALYAESAAGSTVALTGSQYTTEKGILIPNISISL